MFRINVGRFEAASADLLQVTQNVRVSKARTKEAIDSLEGKLAGDWFKSGKFAASRYTRKLEDLEEEMAELVGAYERADKAIVTSLLPKRASIFEKIGATAPPGDEVVLDVGVAVEAQQSAARDRNQDLVSRISTAFSSLYQLEGSGAIYSQLDLLNRSAVARRNAIDETLQAYKVYEKAVDEFEHCFAAQLGSKRLKGKASFDQLKDFFSDWKSANGAANHGLKIGAFFSSIFDGSLKLEKAKGMFDGEFDFLSPSKWKDAWKSLKSGMESSSSKKNDVNDIISGLAGVDAKASKVTTRIKSAGKIVGYVGKGLSAITSSVEVAEAYNKQEGDTADKLAAGTVEAIEQGVKVVAGAAAGKAGSALGAKIGGAIGTAVGPGVGTVIGAAAGAVIGFAIGTVADWAIDKGVDWLKKKDSHGESGHDRIVKNIGGVYRTVGGFISNGWKWIRGET